MNPWKILMNTKIDLLTGSSPFKPIVAPLNGNDLLDTILYRSNSIADTSIESAISSKKTTNSNKSVASGSTNNQSKSSTQPVLLSNTSNLSVNSLQSEPLTASTTNIATIPSVSLASPALAAVVASKVRIEAESITTLSVFRLESIAAASGGKVLSFKDGVSSSEVGTATFKFTGVDGYYDVILGAFDENDGQARFEMTKNGTAIGAVTLDQQLGSADAIASTAVARTISTKLQIKNGDTFSIKGFENAGEKARFDYIDFLPVTTIVNTPPVANGDSATTPKNQVVTLLETNLLANDTDADGDKLTLSSVKSAVNGSVVLNAVGNPVFTPTTNFSGNSSFDYLISDGKGGTATATVKVVVSNSAITLPDLVTKFAPKSNPILPTGKDIFAPSFVVNDAGNSSRPAIAEWTRTGKAGETIVLTGWQMDSSTKFFVYGQTNGTNGVLLEAKIQALESDKLDGTGKSNVAAITLPTGLPQGSDYLLWAQNSSGYSQPVMINQTEAWWVKETSTRGQIASVFGRNLSQDSGTQNSQVYLEDSTGKGYWAQVVGVNPYKVDFKVPDALANGNYQVYVHNGDGGQYGWSKPLTMTIDNGLNYTGAVFNVKNYGAKGDGVTNDTAALKAALAAADKMPWATIYLPTGTYSVNESLWTGKDQVRWLGDGKNLTTIKAANGSSQTYLFQASGVNQITFQDLTLNGNASNAKSINRVTQITGSSDLQYLNVKINAEGATPLDWSGNNRVSMQNSEVIGKESYLGASKQIFINGTKFYGTNSAASLITGAGVQMLSITNSVGQNLDASDPNNGKSGKGRFYIDTGRLGINHNQYIGNNQTIDLVVSPTLADQNTGEQILWEQGAYNSSYLGNVTAASVDTISVSASSSAVNNQYYIAIVGGKGIGQSRQVKSFDQASATYTLYDGWNVQPDNTSVIVANKNVSNAVVYGNLLDGVSDYATRQTASLGLSSYFGASNLVIDNNTFHEFKVGIVLWSGLRASPADNNPVSFTQISNNKFDNSGGIVFPELTGAKGTAVLGSSVRNNVFGNSLGISLGLNKSITGANPLPLVNMNVIENNSLGISTVSISEGNGDVANTIFLNNTSSNRGNLNVGVVDGNFKF